MNRRIFLQSAAAWGAARPVHSAPLRRIQRPKVALDNSLWIEWHKPADSSCFDSVSCDGYPLVFRGSYGLLTATFTTDGLSPAGPVQMNVRHRLTRVRPSGGEDALVAEVTLRNTGDRSESGTLRFATSAHPARSYGAERVHLPLTAGPHSALRPLGMNALLECERAASGTVA